MKKTTKLKELFHRGRIFAIAGGACALHSRIAEMNGFECVYMSGGTTACMIYGIPDAGLITATEMVANAERMAKCVDIPLISDSDQGFGNAINVRRTVQEFVRAGVAGIHIEDQPFPKRCGAVKGKEVISIEEAVGKYRAAVDAKNEIDPDFVIIARCDARGISGGSIEEVIERLKAYRAAGADVIYAEMLQTREEIKAVRDAVDGPMMGTVHFLQPVPTLEEMQEMGYAGAFEPGLLGSVSVQAAWGMAKDYMARGTGAKAEWAAKFASYGPPHMFDMVGFPEVAAAEEKYLPADWLKKYEGSLGLYDPRAGQKSTW